MKKLLLSAIIITVCLAGKAFGQAATATIPNVVAAPGTQVTVPVNVTGFNNVSAITMFFEFDPAVVTYVNFQNAAVGFDVFAALYPDGKWRVGLAWSATNPVNINGKLIDIIFSYAGGSGVFDWTEEGCEIAYYNGAPLTVIYTNGSISPVGDATVTIEDKPNAAPGAISIPLDVDFSEVVGGVNSFTFWILYDETKLDFQSVSNVSSQFPGIIVSEGTSPTRLILDYVNQSQSSNLDGKLLDMNFTYSGGSTTLNFDEDLSVVANNDVQEIGVIYIPGDITQDPSTMLTVTLPDLTKDPGTTGVHFPLAVTNFNNIASFEFHIGFDPGVLSFVGLANYLSPLMASQFQVNATEDGQLGISWNGGPVSFTTGNLFDIVFDYNTGNSTLLFDQVTSEVADDDLVPQNVIYTDGSITGSLQYEATATIANVLATNGQPVDVPLFVTGFTNLGAINFDIQFDPYVLSFVELRNVHPDLVAGGSYSSNAVDGHLYIEWQVNPQGTGPNIADAKLFDMRFSFVSGNSALTFIPGNCEVSHADVNVSPLLVAYYDGSVYGGVVSLEQSTITANPVEVALNETSIITVQLKDQLGNLLPGSGGTVQLFTTLGTLTAVTDNYDGTYTASLTANASGIATITGTLNGNAFTDNATVKVFYLLTLQIAGSGKVKIAGVEYTQPSQVISVTTPTVLLESIPITPWHIYSWKVNNVLQTPLGAINYSLTMDADKTVLATFHLPGDANCNGFVTVTDIVAVRNYLLLANPSPFCYENADVNRSNSVTVTDITLIRNILLNP